jgi:uncharacterized phage protein gp47/JayE
MPLIRPSLAQLVQANIQDIQSRLEGADAALPVEFLGVLAIVLAGGYHPQYGNIAYIAKQLFPDTAEKAYLERLASFYGLARKPATPAQFQVSVVGTSGVDIPPGTLINRSDAAQFASLADTSLLNGTATPTFSALVPGSAGNTPVGAVLQFATGIANVNVSVTVTSIVAIGNDAEKDDQLRQRLIFRMANPPMGGAAADYIIWTTAQPGVTRAWVYPNWLGLGTVGVAFVMDGRPNIFPLPSDVAQVQAAVGLLKPVTASLFAFSPSPVAINPTMHLNIADNPSIRAAVMTELNDFVTRVAVPGAALGQPAQGTIFLSQLEEAIGSASGVVDYQLISPAATMAMAPGAMAALGQVSFQ